jgi:lysozyme family protein
VIPASRAWRRAEEFRREVEGGLVIDPHDPGGATYAGVSLRAVERLDDDGDGALDFDLDGDGHVDADDIRELARRCQAGSKAAEALVEGFYSARYWNLGRVTRGGASLTCDDLPWPLSLLAYDAAVHHGPGAAVLLLQRSLGLRQADGAFGPATVAAANAAHRATAYVMLAKRNVLLTDICRCWERAGKAQPWRFFEGWLVRTAKLGAAAALEA